MLPLGKEMRDGHLDLSRDILADINCGGHSAHLLKRKLTMDDKTRSKIKSATELRTLAGILQDIRFRLDRINIIDDKAMVSIRKESTNLIHLHRSIETAAHWEEEI